MAEQESLGDLAVESKLTPPLRSNYDVKQPRKKPIWCKGITQGEGGKMEKEKYIQIMRSLILPKEDIIDLVKDRNKE